MGKVRGAFSITLVGDILPGGDFADAFAQVRDSWFPNELKSWFDSDLVFANLESVASTAGQRLPNKVVVHATPESLQLLQDVGIGVVSLANNHQMDFGIEASEVTRSRLDELGVKYGGVGRNLAEARKPLILDVAGRKIAFLFYTWYEKGYLEPVPPATATSPGVSPYRIDEILDDIQSVRGEESPDLLFVSLHWGEGLSHYPLPASVRDAHAIIDAGADLIAGHHTHCLQGWELYKGKPIFYSLGHFFCSVYNCSEDYSMSDAFTVRRRYRGIRQRKSIVARVTFDDRGCAAIDYVPIFQERDQPRLHVPDEPLRSQIRSEFEAYSRHVRHPGYGRWRYQCLRRWSEYRRILEDFRQDGWRWAYLSPASLVRVLRKLTMGKSTR